MTKEILKLFLPIYLCFIMCILLISFSDKLNNQFLDVLSLVASIGLGFYIMRLVKLIIGYKTQLNAYEEIAYRYEKKSKYLIDYTIKFISNILKETDQNRIEIDRMKKEYDNLQKEFSNYRNICSTRHTNFKNIYTPEWNKPQPIC